MIPSSWKISTRSTTLWSEVDLSLSSVLSPLYFFSLTATRKCSRSWEIVEGPACSNSMNRWYEPQGLHFWTESPLTLIFFLTGGAKNDNLSTLTGNWGPRRCFSWGRLSVRSNGLGVSCSDRIFELSALTPVPGFAVVASRVACRCISVIFTVLESLWCLAFKIKNKRSRRVSLLWDFALHDLRRPLFHFTPLAPLKAHSYEDCLQFRSLIIPI